MGEIFEIENKHIFRCLLLKYHLIFYALFVFDLLKCLSKSFKTHKIAAGKAPNNVQIFTAFHDSLTFSMILQKEKIVSLSAVCISLSDIL